MKTPAAFKATYADWKLIKTRGCIQIVFEVPLHEADPAYQCLGGMPDPASERWFGIAPLNLQNAKEVVPAATQRQQPATSPDADSTAPRRAKVAPEKRLAQQAGICCNDPIFWKFVTEWCLRNGWFSNPVTNEYEAANFVRAVCLVSSRSELIVGSMAASAWEKLHSQFLIWRDAPELESTDHRELARAGGRG